MNFLIKLFEIPNIMSTPGTFRKLFLSSFGVPISVLSRHLFGRLSKDNYVGCDEMMSCGCVMVK